MIWTYITVLSLGVVLGWKLSRLFDQISKTTSNPQTSPAPSSVQTSNESSQTPEINSDELHDANPSSAATPVTSPAMLDPSMGYAIANPSYVADSASASPAPPAPVAPPASPAPIVPADETLQLAYEMAHHMGQYKAGFLARTSHELRSPLNRVMSLQQLILADLCDSPEEERDFTRQSYEAAQELLDLLDQTTAISKLEHGTVNPATEAVSLVKVLSELEMQTGLHAKNRNLRLSIEHPDTDIEISTDPRWLRQVLLNLVTTPIYLMDSGHIDVTHQVNPGANTLSITVTDERPNSGWSEPINLLENTLPAPISSEEKQLIAPKPTASPEKSSAWGLSLITTTKLMESINGSLTILSVPDSSEDGKTSIQCIIPLS